MSGTEHWSDAKEAAQMYQELNAEGTPDDEDEEKDTDQTEEFIDQAAGTSAKYLPNMRKGPKFDAYKGTADGSQGLVFKDYDF